MASKSDVNNNNNNSGNGSSNGAKKGRGRKRLSNLVAVGGGGGNGAGVGAKRVSLRLMEKFEQKMRAIFERDVFFERDNQPNIYGGQ